MSQKCCLPFEAGSPDHHGLWASDILWVSHLSEPSCAPPLSPALHGSHHARGPYQACSGRPHSASELKNLDCIFKTDMIFLMSNDNTHPMKIFFCCSESHQILRDKYFLPSLPPSLEPVERITATAGTGEYQEPDWFECIAKKIEWIVDSINTFSGQIFIWSDVDIVFLRDPVENLISHITNRNADLLLLREHSNGTAFNGGFYVCKASSKLASFFSAILAQMRSIPKGNDQDIANSLLPESGLCWDHLPLTYSACSHGRGLPPQAFIYHANGTPGKGGIQQKVNQLDAVMSRATNGRGDQERRSATSNTAEVEFCRRRDLLSLIPSNATTAEIGVFQGAFSEEILQRCPARHYMVDFFDGICDSGGEDGEPMIRANLTEEYCRLSGLFMAMPQVSLVKSESVAWLKSQSDHSIDWIYIDSGHTYALTAAELCEAWRVIKPGGWVCGHDYSPAFEGVIRAVDEFVTQRNLQIVFTTHAVLSSFAIKKTIAP